MDEDFLFAVIVIGVVALWLALIAITEGESQERSIRCVTNLTQEDVDPDLIAEVCS